MLNISKAAAALSGLMLSSALLAQDAPSPSSVNAHETCSGKLVLNQFDEKLADGKVSLKPLYETMLDASCGRWGATFAGDFTQTNHGAYQTMRLEQAMLRYQPNAQTSLAIGRLGELRYYDTSFSSPILAPLLTMDKPWVSQKIDNPDSLGLQLKHALTLADWTVKAEGSVFADINPEATPANLQEDRGNSRKPSALFNVQASQGVWTLGTEGGLIRHGVIGTADERFTSLFAKMQTHLSDDVTLKLGQQTAWTSNFANQRGVHKTLSALYATSAWQPNAGPLTAYAYSGANFDSLADNAAHLEAGLRLRALNSQQIKAFLFASHGWEIPLEGQADVTKNTLIGGRMSYAF